MGTSDLLFGYFSICTRKLKIEQVINVFDFDVSDSDAKTKFNMFCKKLYFFLVQVHNFPLCGV